jgi:hypothetical protein
MVLGQSALCDLKSVICSLNSATKMLTQELQDHAGRSQESRRLCLRFREHDSDGREFVPGSLWKIDRYSNYMRDPRALPEMPVSTEAFESSLSLLLASECGHSWDFSL